MPWAPPKHCPAGHPAYQGKRCPVCSAASLAVYKARFEARRPSAAARGYDSAWRKLRSDFIAAHPICCVPGCGQPATDVDHIQPVASHPELRLTWSNLRAMCHPHHSSRTAREQGFARATGDRGSGFRAGAGEPTWGVKRVIAPKLGIPGKEDPA